MDPKAIESGRAFDAVIFDLTVPGGLGGGEVIQELLALDPKIKVIVSSGYSNDPVMSEYKKYGFRGVVTKPYAIEELSESLYKVERGFQRGLECLNKPFQAI